MLSEGIMVATYKTDAALALHTDLPFPESADFLDGLRPLQTIVRKSLHVPAVTRRLTAVPGFSFSPIKHFLC